MKTKSLSRDGRYSQAWPPYMVLMGAVMLTLVATYYVSKTSEAKDHLQFQNSIRITMDSIQDRLDTYISLLRGGTGLFAASSSVDPREFHAYVERLNLQEEYPGIQGIGYSVRLRPEERGPLIEFMRRHGVEDFEIKPDYPREEYHSIIYLEPLDRRNQAAIGYDMYSEPVRRAAMASARDSGLPVASGKVTLVQEIDEQKQAGFLIYVPVYEGGHVPATEPERQRLLRGFVYSPFRADDLLRGIFGMKASPLVDFRVYDGGELTPEHLLHDSNPQRAPADDGPAGFTDVQTLNIAGRTWSLSFSARPEGGLGSGRWLVPFILMGGLLTSLVLFVVTRSQAKAHAAAARTARVLLESEKALKASEERYRQLFENASDIVYALDNEGRFVSINKAGERITGYPREELLDSPADKIVPPEYHGSMHGMLERKKAGEPVTIYEIEIVSKDGTRRTLEVSSRLVFEEGKPAGVQGIARDVTERKRAEEERAQLLAREQEARKQAEEANRLKDEFLATVSHELRTPLTAVLGWVRMIRMGQLDSEAAERALESIERNAKLQSQIIDDLLDVSRIITGNLQLNVQNVDLIGVIQAAIDAVRPAAAAKQLTISTSLDPDARAITGDQGRLQQVVWNLLSNAVKFTPIGGSVDVRLEGCGSHVELVVADTGQGIHEEFLPFVFDRFRQADSTISRKHGGLGLGLSIVRHLVELHGGTVRAESEGKGKGATFTVRLPVFHSQDGAGRAPAALRQARPQDEAIGAGLRLDGLNVLVVDDEADTRDLLASALAMQDVKVRAASSAGEAMELMKSWKPDVLVSDIGMPGEDGYQLIRKVRALSDGGRDIPAIALTAYAREEDRARALSSGYQRHLAKPVDLSELLNVIAALAGRPSAPERGAKN